ncbi:glycosyltransferase family 9 protein [Paraburkholderia susongensis]|uniref:ADP-heptose:LPS heptosyltransferase n=1 Tax=Paraburkholderia susongensis TaxID=1515439 RepID=A0A1X7JGM0_9BURK|nr:glycosyltransferase family 9 protein [Paraburkholderia susongensis]SMG26846.1 ADP-heptose:LPS heptosyltransferase [Paraburkholderia susongensis]
MNSLPVPRMAKDKPRRVAVVMSNAIGDTLVLMVIVKNLLGNGIDVAVFGRPAHALRHWFPHVAIQPLPDHADAGALLAPYDTVLQMHRNQPMPRLTEAHPCVLDLDEVVFGDRSGCMAERFADFCRDELGLPDVDLSNGITPPPALRHRHYIRRIAIHPEASTEDKRWLSERFVKLARNLRQRGYDVHFVIAPHERERWRDLERWGIPAPEFSSPHELACWLYESGWFIGNDSGVGHLASNLRIPTISLFRRRRVSERWRPAWGTVNVVLPWQWVPTARLKEKFWRQTLTCARVLSTFQRMVQDDRNTAKSGSRPL